MKAKTAAVAARESYDAPALVYTREGRNFKEKTWTWSDPGPMASAQHAERKEIVAATPQFDTSDFQARWWAGESWDWD
jgi:hypothetical protein